MSPEQLAVAGMFTLYTGGVGTIMKVLWTENRRLTSKLDDSNSASRDLITVVVKLLEGGGVTVIPTPPERR